MRFGLVVLTSLALTTSVIHAAPTVLATVDGVKITSDDLDDRVKSFPPQYAEALKEKENRLRLLEQLINEKILVAAAKKAGLNKSVSFQRQADAAQSQLLIAEIMRTQVDAKVKVSDDEVKAYFQNNPQQFQETEERRASHVLVKTEDEAKQVAEQVKNGADFGNVADQKSIDPSAKTNHGDLGFFGKGQMVPEFEQAVFSMSKGQVSAPIKTQFGYHVIKLNDIQVRPKVDFTPTVAAQIKESLMAQKRRTVTSEYLNKLQSNSKVINYLQKM